MSGGGKVGSGTMLGGQIALNEKNRIAGADSRVAAWALAVDMLFRSVDMVDMRLSTISDRRFCFS